LALVNELLYHRIDLPRLALPRFRVPAALDVNFNQSFVTLLRILACPRPFFGRECWPDGNHVHPCRCQFCLTDRLVSSESTESCANQEY